MTTIKERCDFLARYTKAGGKNAVEANIASRRAHDAQTHCVDCPWRKVIHPLVDRKGDGLTSVLPKHSGQRPAFNLPGKVRIVLLKLRQVTGPQAAQGSPLKHRAIPSLVAFQTPVDQPGVHACTV